eukprot:937209-Prorocentrum_minimum.AAC.1
MVTVGSLNIGSLILLRDRLFHTVAMSASPSDNPTQNLKEHILKHTCRRRMIFEQDLKGTTGVNGSDACNYLYIRHFGSKSMILNSGTPSDNPTKEYCTQ